MQAVLSKKTPEFEMLPVVAANYYPFEMGSFKPYTHFRVGIKEDEGVFVNITAYQQFDWIKEQFPNHSDNFFFGNCVSFSVGKENDDRYVNITCDVYNRLQAHLCCGSEAQVDITDRVLGDFEPLYSTGFSEVGYYWISTFLFSKELLESLFGEFEYDDLTANGFVVCENPAFPHFGSVNPITDLGNHTVYRTDGLDKMTITRM